jgi:hypothetical protein
VSRVYNRLADVLKKFNWTIVDLAILVEVHPCVISDLVTNKIAAITIYGEWTQLACDISYMTGVQLFHLFPFDAEQNEAAGKHRNMDMNSIAWCLDGQSSSAEDCAIANEEILEVLTCLEPKTS